MCSRLEGFLLTTGRDLTNDITAGHSHKTRVLCLARSPSHANLYGPISITDPRNGLSR